jgi:hypothetical protein
MITNNQFSDFEILESKIEAAIRETLTEEELKVDLLVKVKLFLANHLVSIHNPQPYAQSIF